MVARHDRCSNGPKNCGGRRAIEPGLLGDPAVQSLAVPGLAAFVAAGILRAGLGREKGARFAAAAVGLGLIAAYLVIFRLPPLPPVASTQKLFYVLSGGLLLGAVLDWLGDPLLLRWPLILGALLGLLYWLGLPRLAGEAGAATLVLLAALFAGFVIAAARLDDLRKSASLDAPVLLMIASLGLAAIALLGHAPGHAQLGLALAAAGGGVLLWNWPKRRFEFGASFLFGAALPFFAVAAVLALFDRPSFSGLALLLLVFFADLPARRVKFGSGPLAEAAAPVWLALVALVPAGLAVGVAWLIG